MTPLEAVAKFLGEPYKVKVYRLIYKPIDAKDFIDEERIIRLGVVLTPGDLLLALLERAAELDANPYLSHDLDWFARLDRHTENEVHGSYFDVQKFTGIGPTPLAALCAAIEQLEDK